MTGAAAVPARPAQPPRVLYPPAAMAAIPPELIAHDQWVGWLYLWAEGKRGHAGHWTKTPHMARTPERRASSTDPATWAPFADAVRALARAPWLAGLGFVLRRAAGIVGVDVDHCLDETGAPDATARAVLALLPGTYCEVSPSGRGLRFFARATLPVHGRKRGSVEVYEDARFLTVTGRRFGNAPSVVADCQAGLDAVHARFIAKADAQPSPRPARPGASAGARPIPCAVTDDDRALLARMYASAAGDRIRALYAGETAAYDGDASAADLALVNHLLYWTDGDAGRADALFRGSGLMRPKWDEQRGAMTYGQRTLATAADGMRTRPAAARGNPLAVAPRPAGWSRRVLGAVPLADVTTVRRVLAEVPVADPTAARRILERATCR